MAQPGVLFDVDGTLVDTTYLHAVAWWEALRQHDRDVPMAMIHRSIGMGSDNLLEHLLGKNRDQDLDEQLSTAHDILYGAKNSKPAPDILQAALDQSDVDPKRCVFVGDAVWDVQAAAQLDIPCIGLTCGGTSAAELKDAGAVATYDDPGALLAALAESPIARI